MKVTSIAYSRNLTAVKHARLSESAQLLGMLRSEVWNEFGSLKGVGITHRDVRDGWLAQKRQFAVPARLWKETLRDVFADIGAYREAAKEKVRKAIPKRYPEADRKAAYVALKWDRWPEDPCLSRMMRKHFKHGHTSVRNQIVLDTGCYSTFVRGGKAWLSVMSLEKGKRIAIPLNTSVEPTGTLRLIIKPSVVEVHYAVDPKKAGRNTRPAGTQKLGIDKGYTEAYTDSDGEVHGAGLGPLLSTESDYLKVKYQKRNKLQAIAEKAEAKGNHAKAHRIKTNNLGRVQLDTRKARHRSRVKDLVYKATHSVFDKAGTVAVEDLTAQFATKKLGRNTNRRLSGWVKGLMADAIEVISQRRSAVAALVNCAYTSQMDSRYGVLYGTRKGDSFYCFDGVVLDADHNAARNILGRLSDPEIGRFTPYKEVRTILQDRTRQWLGLLSQGSRYQDGEQLELFATTPGHSEYELPSYGQLWPTY